MRVFFYSIRYLYNGVWYLPNYNTDNMLEIIIKNDTDSLLKNKFSSICIRAVLILYSIIKMKNKIVKTYKMALVNQSHTFFVIRIFSLKRLSCTKIRFIRIF